MVAFSITGPGKYRRRNRQLTTIRKIDPIVNSYVYEDDDSDVGFSYQINGRLYFDRDSDNDLVEGPLANEPEMAGLTGFVRIPNGAEWNQIQLLSNVSDAGHENATVIDLSRIPPSAIVRPEPKRETRKVTLAMYGNGAVHQWSGPVPPEWNPNPQIVAIIEREIEFTVGEGLEVKS